MGDEGEIWQAVREAARKHKQANRDNQQELIDSFVAAREAKMMTLYQYRFWGFLDIDPSNKKWHDIATGKRGRYHDLALFLSKNAARIS